MKLHRSDKKPDWEKISIAEHNSWQRVAARTNGYVTLGNAFTIIGFASVVYGLLLIAQHHYWMGLFLVVFGRGCDLLDGLAAEATGTKSSLGEKMDAGFDKLGTALTIIVFAVSRVAPWSVMLLVLLPQVIIMFISYVAYKRGKALHPSRVGKIGMAVAWAGLFGLVCAKAVAGKPYALVVVSFVSALVTLSIVMALYTAVGYARQVFAKT